MTNDQLLSLSISRVMYNLLIVINNFQGNKLPIWNNDSEKVHAHDEWRLSLGGSFGTSSKLENMTRPSTGTWYSKYTTIISGGFTL